MKLQREYSGPWTPELLKRIFEDALEICQQDPNTCLAISYIDTPKSFERYDIFWLNNHYIHPHPTSKARRWDDIKYINIENFTDNELVLLRKPPQRSSQATKLAYILSIGTLTDETEQALQDPEGYHLTSSEALLLRYGHRFYTFTPHKAYEMYFHYTLISQILTNPFKLITKVIDDING